MIELLRQAQGSSKAVSCLSHRGNLVTPIRRPGDLIKNLVIKGCLTPIQPILPLSALNAPATTALLNSPLALLSGSPPPEASLDALP